MATLKNTLIDDNGFFTLPVGTEGQRPSNPTIGMMRYNTESESVEVYNGEQWKNIGSTASAPPWQILMHTNQNKSSQGTPTSLGSPGSTTWQNITASSTGANSRTSFGDGVGLYKAFFEQTEITQIALVSGDGSLDNPASNSTYLVYDLDESTGPETMYELLARLDQFNRTSSDWSNTNGSNAINGPSSQQFVAGSNGRSGLLSQNGGQAQANSAGTPSKFAIWAINTDSDDDAQALVAYDNNLNDKSDSFRGNNPRDVFWSYWGDDFYSDSQQETIGRGKQTNPGRADGASGTENIYLLAFSG